MNKRDIKKQCLIEALEETVVGVEMIINKIYLLNKTSQVVDHDILAHDNLKLSLELELSLATLCILIRKMSENLYIQLPHELRRDINSLIHSNRFEFDNNGIIVYSQKGKEDIQLDDLLIFAKDIIHNK